MKIIEIIKNIGNTLTATVHILIKGGRTGCINKFAALGHQSVANGFFKFFFFK
jgi:hypothetical protein